MSAAILMAKWLIRKRAVIKAVVVVHVFGNCKYGELMEIRKVQFKSGRRRYRGSWIILS